MATDWRKTINDKYDETLKAQKGQAQAAHDTAKAGYQKQLDDAPAQYNALKNEASVNKQMQDRIRKENMANMGMSGAGGTSRTFQQRNANNYLNNLGNITRQQEDFADNVKLALSNLNTQFGADVNSMTAQNNAARNAELLAQNQWQSGYDLQNRQFDFQGRQFDYQKEQDVLKQENTEFGYALSLLEKRKITRRQFENMTGVKLSQGTSKSVNRDKRRGTGQNLNNPKYENGNHWTQFLFS